MVLRIPAVIMVLSLWGHVAEAFATGARGTSLWRGGVRALQSVATSQAAASKLQPRKNIIPMPHIIETKGVPIYLFTDPATVEPGAITQLSQIAQSGIAEGYVSAMPDVHVGKGATVGTVFASKEWVCPNAVGVDIGCGMGAVPVRGLYKADFPVEMRKKVQQLVKKRIPTGFNEHATAPPGARQALKRITEEVQPTDWLQSTLSNKHFQQVGTLGGGNHFLEVVYDENEQVWILLHSGSRNIGNVVAQYYDKVAKQSMLKHGHDTKCADLNVMHIDSYEGKDYLRDMTWSQRYAFENRMAMLKTMKEVVKEVTGKDTEDDKEVNIHHNFCRQEPCTYTDPKTGSEITQDLWVTRKGATSAKPGELGIIPGSMGTGSYIVRGKGSPKSWQSCSHGAGRKLSRTAAMKILTQQEFTDSLVGIVCDSDESLRDEAPQAYKDLDTVMAFQQDLVEVVHHLRPLVNVKGVGQLNSKYYRKKA